MNLLKTIIERLNQRIEVANIFDKIFTLCELNENGNDKAWVHYIGNGQGEVVTNFDSKQGTIFWAKRSRVTISKTESFKVSGCKQLYLTTFPLTCYAVVRKSHLPCDSEDATDWLASRIYRLTSGTDVDFKVSIGVIQYEVIPNSYTDEIKSLTSNYEWACVAVDIDVNIVSASDEGCYDVCSTGDIPLPNLQPCVPCLTEVAVDGFTITGNGTTGDPLVAIGGGGGTPLITKDEGTNVSINTSTLNFTGAGVTASLTSPGVVQVNVPGGSGVTSVSGTAPIASSGGANPNISISQADTTTDGYLSAADYNTFDSKQDVLNAGTDISIVANVVNNTAPDQVVVLTAGTDIAVSGTYPNFTIDNTAPSSGGTVTSVDLTMPSAFTVSGNPITTSGTLAVTGAGITSQYIRGDGSLDTFPTIPVVTGFVPYTGATQDVNLGVNGLTAHDVTVSHPSGSGVALSVTKGGSGEGLTVVKTSGSGNAASITGGVTLISDLHLTTDLADAYIASAATWNAKQDAITLTTTGTSGAATLTGATLNIPQYAAPVIFKSTVDSASFLGTVNTVVYTQLISANTYSAGNIIRVSYRAKKIGTAGALSLRIFANATPNLSGTPLLLGIMAQGQPQSRFNQMLRHLVIKSSTNNTEVCLTNFTVTTDIVNTGDFAAIAINWTTAIYFVFALQNNVATDTNFGSMYLIEKL